MYACEWIYAHLVHVNTHTWTDTDTYCIHNSHLHKHGGQHPNYVCTCMWINVCTLCACEYTHSDSDIHWHILYAKQPTCTSTETSIRITYVHTYILSFIQIAYVYTYSRDQHPNYVCTCMWINVCTLRACEYTHSDIHRHILYIHNMLLHKHTDVRSVNKCTHTLHVSRYTQTYMYTLNMRNRW